MTPDNENGSNENGRIDELQSGSDSKVPNWNWKTMVGNFTGDNQTNGNANDCQLFMRRFEKCVDLWSWNDVAAISAFEMCLKGTALMWITNFSIIHPNKVKNWSEVKDAFRKEFDNTYKPQDKVASLRGLIQDKTESVGSFAIRVEYTVLTLDMNEENTVACDAIISKFQVDDETEENRRKRKKAMEDIYKVGRDAVRRENMLQYFCNGLRPAIKTKTLAIPNLKTYEDFVAAAKQVELAEDKHTNSIAAVDDIDACAEKAYEASTECRELKELDKSIDALLQKFRNLNQNGNGRQRRFESRGRNAPQQRNVRGNGRFRGRSNFNSRQNGNGNNTAAANSMRMIQCFRCKKWGYHRANNCPIPNEQLSEIKEQQKPPPVNPWNPWADPNNPLNY